MTAIKIKRDLLSQRSVVNKWRFALTVFVVVIAIALLKTFGAPVQSAIPGTKRAPAGQEKTQETNGKPDLVPQTSTAGQAATSTIEDETKPDNKKPQETDRQKELRAAQEKERAERGITIKKLKTKLVEAERSKSTGPLQLTFDDLVFEMEKGGKFKRSMLQDEHLQLHRRNVSVSGFIRPSARQSGLTQFVFVRDNMECCFGPGAALFDCILVKLADGQKTEYTVRPVTIEGEFYIKEYRGPNGKAWAIYRMKNGHVK